MFNSSSIKGGAGEIETFAMKNCIMLLSTQAAAAAAAKYVESDDASNDVGRAYGCKTCGKRFPSFQALGGHRASHKKDKNAAEANGEFSVAGEETPMKPKIHACSICGEEFSVGQALGGHMRRHRPVVVVGGSRNGSTVTTEASLDNSDGNNNNKRENDDVLSVEVWLKPKKLKVDPVRLDLTMWFGPCDVEEVKKCNDDVMVKEENKSDGVTGDGEVEEGEIVDQDDEEMDFLRLELRQPIGSLIN